MPGVHAHVPGPLGADAPGVDVGPAGRAPAARDLRRAATAAVVTGPLVALYHDAATPPLPGGPASPWWLWPGVVLAGLLAAVVVAGYVAPRGSGRIVERGCTPCAFVPAVSVVGSLLVLDGTRTGSGMFTATGMLVFALLQRRTSAATTCAAPRVPPARP